MAKHTSLIEYADVRRRVEMGKMVAIAPVVNEDGQPRLIMVTSSPLAPYQIEMLMHSSRDERSALALQAIRQVREHFEIDDPKGTT